MAKLLVYIAFIIYCGGQAGNQGGAAMQGGVGTEIITDYKVDKLWDDWLINTNNAIILSNCDRMEDGRVSILEEKPLLFVRNTLNLIK
ncbi:unnamed protein product [Brugia pahangi]|uniref:Recep_L_domain domain-containing protein n=1 Tax=Brugia pahangi TaxID=6280 RepID=A0A0N4T6C6_BRUPA|nr:unnamed protein product [Brugia pahangi]